LTAAEFWRKAVGPNGSVRDHDLDYADWEKWKKRGEKSCRIVYGDNYQRLRESIRKLHPAFEAWMITEAYGRTLSRPKLDMKRRELCTVVQTAVLNTPRQLHAHLRGSLNAGASFEEVEAAIALINPFLPYDDWKGVRERWERVRDGWSPLE
jgi:4-carboxymuconolactone decarboxylase